MYYHLKQLPTSFKYSLKNLVKIGLHFLFSSSTKSESVGIMRLGQPLHFTDKDLEPSRD